MIADVDGKVLLVEALIARDPTTVKLLWENNATLQNADKGQLLGQAVQDNNVDLIENFLLYGANINESDEEGLTPLHVAVLHGQVSMAKYLLFISLLYSCSFKKSTFVWIWLQFLRSPLNLVLPVNLSMIEPAHHS